MTADESQLLTTDARSSPSGGRAIEVAQQTRPIDPADGTVGEGIAVGKILVGTGPRGGTSSEPALMAAAALAWTQGAELVVIRPDEADRGEPAPGGSPSPSTPNLTHIRRRFPELSTRTRSAASSSMLDVFEVARDEMPDVLIVCDPCGGGDGTREETPPAVDLSVLTGEDEGSSEVAASADVIADGLRAEMAEKPATGLLSAIRAFYSRRISWAALVLTSLLLTFGGGAVMFWLHARYRGEKGPPINDWYHWFLDSTIGFVTLTPVLFVILPGVLVALGDHGRPGARVRVWCYAAVVGLLFTLVTGPGPLVHNFVAGEGTPLANLATELFGRDAAVAARNMHAPASSPLTEALLQLGAGLPVYIGLTWLALHIIRTTNRRQQA